MEHINFIQKRTGADLGWHKSNIHPHDREGCVGKNGLDKNLSLGEVIEIAYKIHDKPNIIVKPGPRTKWYLKRCNKELIDEEIQNQRNWRDISNSTMWIIDWDM